MECHRRPERAEGGTATERLVLTRAGTFCSLLRVGAQAPTLFNAMIKFELLRGICSLLTISEHQINSVEDAKSVIKDAKVDSHYGQAVIIALHPTSMQTYDVGDGLPNPRVAYLEAAGFERILEWPNGHWQTRNAGGTMILMGRLVYEDKAGVPDQSSAKAAKAASAGNSFDSKSGDSQPT